MAGLLLLTVCWLIQSIGKSKISSHAYKRILIPAHALPLAGAVSQSVSPTPTTADYDDILMPATVGDSSDGLTLIAVSNTPQPLPTPTSSIEFITPDVIGSGSGLVDLFSVYQTSESRSPTISPSPTNTIPEPMPTPDVIIKLRLNISIGITDQERMQIDQNLSLFIKDILQLTTLPLVWEEPGNIFNVLIVSSSSMNAGVASGNISAIAALLAGMHTSGLLRVDVSQS